MNGMLPATLMTPSFLAGYILTLVYCFPESGDDIRMRLYLADISTAQGKIPAVKFFWGALMKTSVFSTVLSSEDAALRLLKQQQQVSEKPATSIGGIQLEREWRTVLLFLELYIFVLRLTDDEDFFQGLQASLNGSKPDSRIRASALSLPEVKSLSLFLRNLGFTLHWNGSELANHRTSQPTEFLISSAPRSRSSPSKDSSLSIAMGIDFAAFKASVTTTVQMLYERTLGVDSCRRITGS